MITPIYEDNHLLVVVKPPRIPVQADDSGDRDLLTLLKEAVKVRYNKPGAVYLGLVHRLDRPVGGVMVFARTSKAAARLSQVIREGKMDKRHGRLPRRRADRLSEKRCQNPFQRRGEAGRGGGQAGQAGL